MSLHRPVRFAPALALAATALFAACESVKVVVPDVVTVTVSPASSTLLPGATAQMTARALDTDGNALTRTPSWTTSSSSVATVSASGLVTAVDVGTTTVRATVEGRSGTAAVTVVRGPAIQLGPTTLGFEGTQGSANPPSQTIAVTNAGSGTLRDLAATVQYQSSASGWLTALLTTTTAPAQLRVTADIEGLAPGTYRATVSVASQSADNSPQTAQIALAVSELPPLIVLSPASVGFGAIGGEGDPTPREVTITNGGGGLLTQLQTETVYLGGTTGWLETALSATTGPATVTLQARTGNLDEGVYLSTVRVTAPEAVNSPQDVNVTFTVGEG